MPAAALDVPETTVLFLAANPVEVPLLQLGEECRAIEDKIRAAKFREKLRFRSRWAARPDDLLQALHEDDPTVLHFSGHGAGAQGLCFLAEDGRALLVSSDGLGQVIRAAGESILLVVLNACYTRVQAEALIAHVSCVIGMPSAIGDKSAIVYAAELYRALAFGKSVASAHQCGLAALAIHPMDGNMRDTDVAEAVLRTALPELLVRTGVDAGHVHIVQGALPTSTVPASSGESRIHLEIVFDADFKILDKSMLSELVSEISRLTGGRQVRSIYVKKGSIRLCLSFEPEAARTLMSLRDSGRLNRIGGLRVSNVVDLGQVEISLYALDQTDMPQAPSDPVIEIEDVSITAGSKRGAGPPDLVPALTVSAVTAAAAPATAPVPPPPTAPARSRRVRWIAGLGIALGTGASLGLYAWSRFQHVQSIVVEPGPVELGPAAIDAGAAAPEVADELPPGWTDRPFTIDRDRVYLVGDSDAASIEQAIPLARDRAIARLLDQLLRDLATSPIHDFLTERAADIRIGGRAIAAFNLQHGNLASFERVDVATARHAGKPRVFVRFGLPVEHYERILAEYRDVYELRGMTLARVFPALLEVMQPAGGLVVLKVRAGSPAAVAGVSPGDSLLGVGGQRVTTVEELRAAARSVWQPDVRRRLTVEIEHQGLTVEIEHQGTRRRVFVERLAGTGAP